MYMLRFVYGFFFCRLKCMRERKQWHKYTEANIFNEVQKETKDKKTKWNHEGTYLHHSCDGMEEKVKVNNAQRHYTLTKKNGINQCNIVFVTVFVCEVEF